MRIETSATCLSWIPSEAVTGLNKVAFGSGFTHYDDPPPAAIDDLGGDGLAALRDADRFRFANHLSVWVDVVDDRIVDAGSAGGGMMGATTVTIGSRHATYAAVSLPDIRRPVEVAGDGSSATFVQTVGGHTALPAPRVLDRPPFLAYRAPIVWSTLRLTIGADGHRDAELIGASRFPRHWVYDHDGVLCAKAGLTEFKDWWRHSFGRHTPWSDEDSEVHVTEVESALERELSMTIMRGGLRPSFRTVPEGATLVDQGDPGGEVFLLLNGVLLVEVDGEPLAELGPGAVAGERAALDGGRRTSTLRAVTPAKVAVVTARQLDRSVLDRISDGHRREDAPQDAP